MVARSCGSICTFSVSKLILVQVSIRRGDECILQEFHEVIVVISIALYFNRAIENCGMLVAAPQGEFTATKIISEGSPVEKQCVERWMGARL